jgi:hypothetical protein
MAKIIHFPQTESYDAADFLEESKDIFKAHEVESVVVICKCKDGEWLTGYHNCDFGTKNEALGHLQADIIDQMIMANIDRYLD